MELETFFFTANSNNYHLNWNKRMGNIKIKKKRMFQIKRAQICEHTEC